jgi:hypothetical protein
MHGLMGGSWKRSSPATDTTKNDPRETAPVTVASRPTAACLPDHHRSTRASARSARAVGPGAEQRSVRTGVP